MTPQELYDAQYIETWTGVNVLDLLQGCYFNHIPEISEFARFENVDLPRIWVHIHGYLQVDYRRFHRLASVWYKGKPVMVIQNAGREGDDHKKRWVTDEATYLEMIGYILSLLPITKFNRADFISSTEDIGDIQNFYYEYLKIGEKTERICYW